MMRTVLLSAVLFAATMPAAAKTYDVTSYGAKPDGVTMNTAAIQRAIDDAEAHGGGTVTFAPGTYLTGSIFVKSKVTLAVPKDVTITGSQSLADYPLKPTRVAGIEMVWPAALINVYEQHDATISGEGTIDGNGKVFWDSYWALRAKQEPQGLRWASDYDAKRPRLIVVYKSKHVTIGGGLILRRPGFWTVHLCFSEDVTVDGVTIRANTSDPGREGHGPSTDGIDIDSSRHILVAHADIENNDDALCLKAGRDADGLRVNRPTEDVVIRDSIVRRGTAGITFGSETSGGFRNIEAYNIRTLADVPSGILFKTAHTRGGFGENIRLHDFVMEGTPVVLRMTMNWNPSYSYATIPPGLTDVPPYYKVLATPVDAKKGLAHFHDLSIWNIHARGAKLVFDVSGVAAAPVYNVTLKNFDVEAQSGGHIENAKDWTFTDMKLTIADGSSVALKDCSGMKGPPQSGAASKGKGAQNPEYEK
jgi:polygalacturonase